MGPPELELELEPELVLELVLAPELELELVLEAVALPTPVPLLLLAATVDPVLPEEPPAIAPLALATLLPALLQAVSMMRTTRLAARATCFTVWDPSRWLRSASRSARGWIVPMTRRVVAEARRCHKMSPMGD